MQLTGAAKLVSRQLVETPDGLLRLQQGDQYGAGNYRTGLMILLEALGQRFAPLEAELTTRAMQDLMNFHRNNGEGIDQLLIRFDMMIRNRAVQRGGMAMTHQGLGWLLMRAIGLSIDQRDRVTDVLGGRMPENEYEFQRICDRLRRLGHSQEPGSHMRAGAA